MGTFFQHSLGFLPKAFVFIMALAIFSIILLSHWLFEWIRGLVELPWMKGENQKNRKEIIDSLRKK
ncbi:hypothetical protein [Bacillus horti]|uniref:Uncharacterized protein n=1 Tax=Caldalkalibacillus horti TaxID=77523 RepID=A0ABT9W5D0_9BACI|nr:hypothetical protein [Bacillus horti]MDQ0168274.1 hypothetical protein [Bacillus horti]